LFGGGVAGHPVPEQREKEPESRADRERDRHPRHASRGVYGTAGFEQPGEAEAALMEAKCEHLSVLDFREGTAGKNALTSAPLATSLTAPAIDQAPGFDTPV
jgi:hypothetical protein